MSDLNEQDIAKINEAAKKREMTIELENVKISDEFKDFLENNPMTKTTVAKDLWEWSRLITELCDRERDLYKVKEEYNALSEKIIAETDFKALYGKNNESVRKQHVKSELSDMYEIIKAHEFGIDYCKRRISYLKSLIRVKSVIMEVKE